MELSELIFLGACAQLPKVEALREMPEGMRPTHDFFKAEPKQHTKRKSIS